MRNAATYFKSWLGRFDAVSRRRPDPWLWLPALALLLLGCLMVLNITYFLALGKTGDSFHFFKLHLLHLGAGLCIVAVLSQFSARGLRRLAMPLMVISAAMLLALQVPGLGTARGGARRWLHLGPVLFEPVEVVKLAVVFFLADHLSRRQQRMRQFGQGPLPAFIVVGLLGFLIVRQPDFGSTVMVTMLMFAMLYAAGAEPKHLWSAGGVALLTLIVQGTTRAYRMRRLTAFLDPWRTARGAGFQLIQSFIALGAGGGWGVGLGAGRQKMFYLPQAHTDFVFAVVGEDFGILGACAVIVLFALILFRGMKIAHDEPDPFASLLAVGLTMLLCSQALVHMAVVIGLIPTKGLPLPFVSYGGTAMMTAMAALGALLALGRRPAVQGE